MPALPLDNYALILGYLAIGLLLRLVPAMPADSARVLNAYVLNVALPALVLLKIPELQFSSQLWLPILTPWLLLILVALLTLLAGKLFKWDRDVIVALLIVLPLGNTSFLGFPMVEAFWGTERMPVAIIYDQLGSFIALATYSTILASVYGRHEQALQGRAIIKKVLTSPPLLALVLALLVRDTSYPPLATQLLSNVAATLVPVVMIAVGFSLRFRLSSDELKPLGFGLLVTLALMPLMAYAIASSVDIEPTLRQTVVFMAAMPPMISAGAIAIMAGLAPRLASALVGFGVLLSFITLPVVYWLLQ
ncbi:AEC family transporter [Alkalimonas collagenimarina]|uniref:AEC family transporter n=1 Tax=Alkalimonas collagenimarina TaxID=400390 RepID=A0ABT9GWU2_9GAMM|nr:AEC family transporter [Alkalimonas collagenimarina]MDP4535533.1 AEC family transporter [Alkalimonas collagenimarina]